MPERQQITFQPQSKNWSDGPILPVPEPDRKNRSTYPILSGTKRYEAVRPPAPALLLLKKRQSSLQTTLTRAQNLGNFGVLACKERDCPIFWASDAKTAVATI
jgi:hypothetical protein